MLYRNSVIIITIICLGGFLLSAPVAEGREQTSSASNDFLDLRGESWDHPYSIVVDGCSNKYVFGLFSGIKDFDPGSGRAMLTSDRDSASYFVKFSPEGEFRWVTAWCDDPVGGISSAAFDTDCNIYLVGNFTDTVDFDPGRREFVRNSNGKPDSYLVKLNSRGKFEWACTWGNDGWDEASGVAVDDDGNIFIISRIWQTFDFTASDGKIRNIAKGGGKSCLIKIDADGNFQDVYRWDACEPKDVAVDSDGFVYIAGDFGLGSALDFGLGMVDFAPGPEVEERKPMSSFNGYLLKLSPEGDFVWVKTWVVPGVMYVFGVAIDNEDNVYIVGEQPNYISIDPDSEDELFVSREMYHTYLINMDTDGVFQWARTWSSADWLAAERIYVDDEGTLYIIGDFSGTVDFDPGPEAAMVSTAADFAAFLIQMDSDGMFHNVYTWQGRLDGFARG